MLATRRGLMLGTAGTLLATPHIARGQAALTPVKFCLDWAFQGPQAPFVLAAERGFFRDEGIAITIDRGFGSGDTPVKVASGAYEFGIADLSPAIRLRLSGQAPDLVAPMVIQQGSPLAVMTLKKSGITTAKQLEGRKVAAPETDSARQLFPAYAKAAGIDASKINWMTVTPQLREPMLVRGEVDAITGFEVSGLFSLRSLNVAEGDVVSMRYSDAGVALLSTALLVKRPYAEANARIVTGMIRAIARGHDAAWKDQDAAIEALVKRDPTAPRALEKARMLANFGFIRTPEALSGGYGNLPMPRVQAAIETIRSSFGISTELKAEDMYLPQFLPPASDLQLPA
ncbi:ABC transporter substrate-binding protein [Pseudoroseomonas cervicalis]|uniref:Thiamine pyrimidine synthase n=1 Tax=Pseudoroseomonas cervicalis ATCC 49957 TaxID=525371 RepID=D5RI87_9PROT|nr:ABC transporter substrate-binding protein [Pseudoroseomonas cervicalis]EFH12982.1 NMT1/THI5-like protein [Pseudoroseomonas cervicalis ATCC 49957]